MSYDQILKLPGNQSPYAALKGYLDASSIFILKPEEVFLEYNFTRLSARVQALVMATTSFPDIKKSQYVIDEAACAINKQICTDLEIQALTVLFADKDWVLTVTTEEKRVAGEDRVIQTYNLKPKFFR